VTELTILMPCLNEAETIETCIRKAKGYLERSGISGEVVIADNGSTDGSQAMAEALGARVVDVPVKGYGAALGAGIAAARGRYIIMGDSDDSYDFSRLDAFVEHLRGGADLVMGNRFKGGIAPSAMPPLHRYLGNPVLSTIGRVFFRAPVGDFHCGLRGFSRQAILGLKLNTPGMEFASEMVIKATIMGLKVTEVPTTLSPDGRSRPPHLRSWRDGWLHLKLLLTFAPNWLFYYPGMALLAVGTAVFLALLGGPIAIAGVTFDIASLILASALGADRVSACVFLCAGQVAHGQCGAHARLTKVQTHGRRDFGGPRLPGGRHPAAVRDRRSRGGRGRLEPGGLGRPEPQRHRAPGRVCRGHGRSGRAGDHVGLPLGAYRPAYRRAPNVRR
jgi:hypothetical protein